MQQHDVKATLFLTDTFIASNPNYFTQFTAHGSKVENHTLSHNLKFYAMGEPYQQQEICGMALKEQQYFGRCPYLVRAPGGAQNTATQRAAAACGMRAIIFWKAKVDGGTMQYQEGTSLKAGDIVLMHFRPAFKQDIDAFLSAAKAAKLTPALLEDWIPEQ